MVVLFEYYLSEDEIPIRSDFPSGPTENEYSRSLLNDGADSVIWPMPVGVIFSMENTRKALVTIAWYTMWQTVVKQMRALKQKQRQTTE